VKEDRKLDSAQICLSEQPEPSAVQGVAHSVTNVHDIDTTTSQNCPSAQPPSKQWSTGGTHFFIPGATGTQMRFSGQSLFDRHWGTHERISSPPASAPHKAPFGQSRSL